MLLNHPKSTLGKCDIQRSESFLCFACPWHRENAEGYRKRLAEWQRVVDRFQLDYANSECGPKYLTECHCCPLGYEIPDMREMIKIRRFDLGFQPWQAPSWHWPMLGPDQQVRHQIFHEFLLRNGVDPCGIGYMNIALMTPTMIAIEEGVLGRWLGALNNAGISIDAVARHTLRIISPEVVTSMRFLYEHNCYGLFPRSRGRLFCSIQRLYESLIDADTLRQYVMDQLAENGCFIANPLGSSEPPHYELAASAVDFVPSSRYNSQRLTTGLRKRIPKAATSIYPQQS